MTFIIIASVVSALGWRYGFLGAGLVGLLGTLIIWRFFHDTPQSKGLPPVNAPKEKKVMSALETTEFNRAQKAVLRSPAIWILALSSAFMYISRYAVNSWGIFYLEAQKVLLYAGCQFHYLYQFGMRHCRNHAFRGGIRQVIQRAPKCSRTDIRIDKLHWLSACFCWFPVFTSGWMLWQWYFFGIGIGSTDLLSGWTDGCVTLLRAMLRVQLWVCGRIAS